MDVLRQVEKIFLDLKTRQDRADEKVFVEDEKAWREFNEKGML